MYYTSGGITRFGIWRDKKFGEPPGPITATVSTSIKSQKVVQVSTSTTAMQGGIDDTFEHSGRILTGFEAKKRQLEDGTVDIEFQDTGGGGRQQAEAHGRRLELHGRLDQSEAIHEYGEG